MSLLGDARELADADMETLTRSGSVVCAVCFKRPHQAVGCPVQSLPRIVAALEAVGRLVTETASEPHACEYTYDESGHTPVLAFCGASTFGPHLPDCPWLALVAALKGEQGPG